MSTQLLRWEQNLVFKLIINFFCFFLDWILYLYAGYWELRIQHIYGEFMDMNTRPNGDKERFIIKLLRSSQRKLCPKVLMKRQNEFWILVTVLIMIIDWQIRTQVSLWTRHQLLAHLAAKSQMAGDFQHSRFSGR